MKRFFYRGVIVLDEARIFVLSTLTDRFTVRDSIGALLRDVLATKALYMKVDLVFLVKDSVDIWT